MTTTFFTPSRNKSEHLREVHATLLSQTNPDWEWLIILNDSDGRTIAAAKEFSRDHRVRYIDSDPRTFYKLYPPAVLINTYFPTVQTKYLMFLADDDLLEPDALASLVAPLEANPDWDVTYGRCEVWEEVESVHHTTSRSIKHGNYWWEPTGWIGGAIDLGHGTGIGPDCNLDGGQFLQTRRSYGLMCQDGWQLATNVESCGHVDGIYMARLAEFCRFHAVDKKVITHRRTALSTIAKPLWGYTR